MTRRVCDICDGTTFSERDPFVQYRLPRPSDKSDMCCTLAGHWLCFGNKSDPQSYAASITTSGGVATGDDWEKWIESPEAQRAGFLFLT